MRGLRAGVALAFGVLSRPSPAIVANPLPRICNEFPHADYVFSGRAVSDTYHWHEYFAGSPSEIYRIRVDHVFKGPVPLVVRLYTAVDSGRGTLKVGQPSIVFAYRRHGHIAFDGSSNSQSGAGASKVIAQIQSYLAHPPKVATIAGRVDYFGSNGANVDGIRLYLTSGTAHKFVRTDSQGKFVAEVAPGRWSVRIAEPGWASRRGIYSYDFAEPVRLAKGGCADLELETLAPGEKDVWPYWKRWPK